MRLPFRSISSLPKIEKALAELGIPPTEQPDEAVPTPERLVDCDFDSEDDDFDFDDLDFSDDDDSLCADGDTPADNPSPAPRRIMLRLSGTGPVMRIKGSDGVFLRPAIRGFSQLLSARISENLVDWERINVCHTRSFASSIVRTVRQKDAFRQCMVRLGADHDADRVRLSLFSASGPHPVNTVYCVELTDGRPFDPSELRLALSDGEIHPADSRHLSELQSFILEDSLTYCGKPCPVIGGNQVAYDPGFNAPGCNDDLWEELTLTWVPENKAYTMAKPQNDN